MMRNLMPILLLAAGTFFYSCKKTDLVQTPETASGNSSGNTTNREDDDREDEFCEATVTPLMAGQHINAGEVSVVNDGSYIYVTYTAMNGYTIKKTHLYAGNCSLVPVNNSGNPVPGQFPYKATHDNVTTCTITVPVSAIPAGSCGCIAAHAWLQKLNANGQVTESQTGWGSGTLINPNGGNWGMKFDYCSCEPM